MPADASIYSMIRPPAITPYIPAEEAAANRMKLSQMMGAGDLQRLQLEQARQGVADDQATRAFYAGLKPGEDPYSRVNDLMRVNPKAGMAMQTQALATKKTQSEIDKANVETLAKSMAMHKDQLAGVNDPQSAAAWVMAGFNDPALSPILQRSGSPQEIISRIPQDPAAFQEWKMRNGLGIDKFAEQLSAAQGRAVTVRGQDLTDTRTREEGAANRGVTVRGQNLTDQRAREVTEAGKWTNDLERGLQVNSATGETRPITQGGAPLGQRDKPLTEFQGKAQMFGTRTAEADQILTSLEDKISTTGLAVKRGAENVPLTGGVLGAIGNTMLSANQQKVEQAQRNFVNAVLRQESGAVISPSEFENAQKQYFPQPGDSKGVITQKRANRQSVIEGFKVEAAQAGGRIERAQQPPPSQSASGRVRPAAPAAAPGGIKFLGFEGG